MKLNCDLGEGLGAVDQTLIPLIDMANIACGGHAGDSHSMRSCTELAAQHKVKIGAHPSYPDKNHFGRASLCISINALQTSLLEQVSQLKAQCDAANTSLYHLKAHGALYHDIHHKPKHLACVIDLCQRFNLALILQAQASNTADQRPANIQALISDALRNGTTIIYEAFADRAYGDDGKLVARHKPHALHRDLAAIVKQTQSLRDRGGLYSESGKWIAVKANTLCVHGDTNDAVAIVKAIRAASELSP